MPGLLTADESKWRAEEDLRTLISAQEIRKDKKRMAAVRKLAREKIEKMKNLSKA